MKILLVILVLLVNFFTLQASDKAPSKVYLDFGAGMGGFAYYIGQLEKDDNLVGLGYHNEFGFRLGRAIKNDLYLVGEYNLFNLTQMAQAIGGYPDTIVKDSLITNTRNYLGAGVVYYPRRQVQLGATLGVQWHDIDYQNISNLNLSQTTASFAYNVTLSYDILRNHSNSFIIGLKYFDEQFTGNFDTKLGAFFRYRFRGLPPRPKIDRAGKLFRARGPLTQLFEFGSLVPIPPTNFFDADGGTAQNPYRITFISNLLWLSVTPSVWHGHHYFIQTNDIDAVFTHYLNHGKGLRPIGTFMDANDRFMHSWFSGTYDGGGHTISNLYIDTSDDDSPTRGTGLFSFTNRAEIKNLHLDSVQISGNDFTGAVAGIAVSTKFINVSSNGVINGGNLSVGGLVGNMQFSSITKCHSSVFIYLDDIYKFPNTGGLVGNLTNGSSIENSYFNGRLVNENGNNISVGGIAGSVHDSKYIKNVYATGYRRFKNAFGIVGTLENTPVIHSYWDRQSTGTRTAGSASIDEPLNVTGLSRLQMTVITFFESWDFENIWDIRSNINNGNPFLRE